MVVAIDQQLQFPLLKRSSVAILVARSNVLQPHYPCQLTPTCNLQMQGLGSAQATKTLQIRLLRDSIAQHLDPTFGKFPGASWADDYQSNAMAIARVTTA